jgi:polar amino acid transport system ATP-binding protein
VTQPALEFKNVKKAFGDHPVLRGIDLAIPRGEVTVVIGSSGCGKSTLLRCVNGLERPDEGEVFVMGERVGEAGSDVNRLRSRVGIVFQAYNLFPHKRVLANVALGPRRVLKMSEAEARERAMTQLRRVQLEEKADAWPAQLSGGQQQRVAIARALAMEPDILLLDEVTAALDPETVGSVLDVIRRLADDGMTMLVVTHEMRFAREVGDRIVFIDKGLIVEEGPAQKVLESPSHERTRAFLRRTLGAAAAPPSPEALASQVR